MFFFRLLTVYKKAAVPATENCSQVDKPQLVGKNIEYIAVCLCFFSMVDRHKTIA